MNKAYAILAGMMFAIAAYLRGKKDGAKDEKAEHGKKNLDMVSRALDIARKASADDDEFKRVRKKYTRG